MDTQHIIVFFVLASQMKIIEDKQTKYAIKLLVILLPMLIVPMASYEFLIFYFKHYTVIYSSMIVGFMIGVIILLVSDKIPRLFKQSTSKISNST
jgi:O-antigen/teichoic acid export membrane protein